MPDVVTAAPARTTARAGARWHRAARGAGVALLAPAVVLGACYRSVAVAAPERLAPGARVELVLTPAGTAALTAVLGPQVERVDGQVEAARQDSLLLRLVRTVRHDAREVPWQLQRVAFAHTHVAALRVRRLDRARAWVAAGLVVGAAALVAGLRAGGGQLAVPDPGPVPPG